MRITAAAAGLLLDVHEPLDPTVRLLLERELDGLASALAPWGRFSRPVQLRTTTDHEDLRAVAPCATSMQLHGVAHLDGLVLLAPSVWIVPPAPRTVELAVLHELAHVLLFQRCAPPEATTAAYISTWFREGMATVIAEGPSSPNRRRELANHPQLAELPSAGDAIMTRHPEACYLAAALLFQAWLDRFGTPVLAALCRAMRAGNGFAAAHERACGVTEIAWIDAWLDAVRAEGRSR